MPKFEVTLRDKRTGYRRTLMIEAPDFGAAERGIITTDWPSSDEEIIKIEKDYDEHQ